jgi:hypothetical protein
MNDQMAVVLGYLFWYGSLAYIIWFAAKEFGWEGIAVKFALFWDGLVVAGSIAARKIPFTHLVAPKPHHGLGLWIYVTGIVVAFFGFFYIMYSGRPTRWLLDRPIWKWTAYVAAAFVCVRAWV